MLVYGPKAGGSRPFKLALMELVAGKCLTVNDTEDRILFGLRKRSVALLAPGARHRPPGSPSLSALLELLDEIPPRTTRGGNVGSSVAKFARKAQRKYGCPDSGLLKERTCVRMLSMNAYSRDLRLKTLAAVDRGIPRKEVSKLFGVSMSTIKRWLNRRRQTGDVNIHKIPARPSVKGRAMREWLVHQLKANPDLTLGEHREAFEDETGMEVSQATTSRQIARLPGKWPLKKSQR